MKKVMLPGKNNDADKEKTVSRDNSDSVKAEPSGNVRAAHEQAEKDISDDPDLSIHSPNDDLDEGETARLGEDKTDLV